MTVETPAPPGKFSITVGMSFADDELADSNVAPEDVELHVLDTAQGSAPGVWVPAGENIGESLSTGVVGDSGFAVYSDKTIDFWAVRKAPGTFAVGAKTTEQDTDGEPGDGDGDSGVTPTHAHVPRLCGLGMMQCALAGVAALIVTTTRRRRF